MQAQINPIKFVFPDFYPVSFYDETGNATGIYIDYVNEIFVKDMELSVIIEILPWARAQELVKLGEVDFTISVATKERLDWSYTSVTLFQEGKNSIYTWEGHPGLNKINNIKSFDDIIELNFSVITYFGNSWIESAMSENKENLMLAPNVESVYKMLIAKRGDVVIDQNITADRIIKEFELDGKIIKTNAVVDAVEFCFLLSKKSIYSSKKEVFFEAIENLVKDEKRNIPIYSKYN